MAGYTLQHGDVKQADVNTLHAMFVTCATNHFERVEADVTKLQQLTAEVKALKKTCEMAIRDNEGGADWPGRIAEALLEVLKLAPKQIVDDAHDIVLKFRERTMHQAVGQLHNALQAIVALADGTVDPGQPAEQPEPKQSAPNVKELAQTVWDKVEACLAEHEKEKRGEIELGIWRIGSLSERYHSLTGRVTDSPTVNWNTADFRGQLFGLRRDLLLLDNGAFGRTGLKTRDDLILVKERLELKLLMIDDRSSLDRLLAMRVPFRPLQLPRTAGISGWSCVKRLLMAPLALLVLVALCLASVATYDLYHNPYALASVRGIPLCPACSHLSLTLPSVPMPMVISASVQMRKLRTGRGSELGSSPRVPPDSCTHGVCGEARTSTPSRDSAKKTTESPVSLSSYEFFLHVEWKTAFKSEDDMHAFCQQHHGVKALGFTFQAVFHPKFGERTLLSDPQSFPIAGLDQRSHSLPLPNYMPLDTCVRLLTFVGFACDRDDNDATYWSTAVFKAKCL